MSDWNSAILTKKGLNLQAKVEAGETLLNVTKIQLGSGILDANEDSSNLIALKKSEKDIEISDKIPQDGGLCTISGVISNQDINIGFYVKEMGLFATDPDEGEILYMYTTDNKPDYLPAKSTNKVVNASYNIDVAISNSELITAKINQVGLVTVEIMQHNITEHDSSEVAHTNLFKNLFNTTTVTAEAIKNKIKEYARDVDFIIQNFNNIEEMKQSNNLKSGGLIKTQGFYIAGDGGGADYVIVNDIGEDEADEVSVITLQKGLYAKLLVQDCVNAKQFGAKGDKATDDTEALQKAINFCKNNNNVSVLLLQEGNYKITDTLNIYLDKFILKGNGNANIIPYMDSSTALVFTTVDSIPYTGRYKHNRKSGGFSILGSNTTNTTLMAVGDGEKSVNCCEWENIVLESATTLLHCKAHSYKNNFYNIIFNSSAGVGNALIYDDLDTSEASNFIGCSFWAGKLQTEAECNFYGCTIHLKSNKIQNSDVINFTNCHFEILNHGSGAIDKAITSTGIMHIDACSFVCSDESADFTNSFFIAESTNNSPAGIYLNKCSLKYFLGRLNSSDNSSLTKGEVYINNTPMKYVFDGLSLKYNVYDNTDTSFYLDKNSYIYNNLTADDVTIEKNDTTNITITGYRQNFSIAKRYLIPSNARSINFIRDFTAQNNVTYLFGGDTVPNVFQGIMFYDYFMNKLAMPNVAQVSASGKEVTSNFWLPIPKNAVYVDVGFYVNGAANGNIYNINKYGVEFL